MNLYARNLQALFDAISALNKSYENTAVSISGALSLAPNANVVVSFDSTEHEYFIDLSTLTSTPVTA